MASTLLNMPDVPAVRLPKDVAKLHRKVIVGEQKVELYGGISKESIKTSLKYALHDFQDFFLAATPSFQSMTATSVNKQLKELRYIIIN